MKLRTCRVLATLAATLLFLAATAQTSSAQTGNIYMSFAGGVLVPDDRESTTATFQETAKINTGGGFTIALGYDTPIGLRLEGEFGYGRTNFGSFSGNDIVSGPFSGDASDIDINIFTFFVNAYYGFSLPGSPIVPWFGGGLGEAHIYEEAGVVTENGVPFNRFSRTTTNFAANGQAGIDFELGDQFVLTPSYRFLWIESGDFTSDFTAHTFWVGLRYNFLGL